MLLKRTCFLLGIALWLLEPFGGAILAASPAHGKHCTMKTACKGTCCCKAPAAPCNEAPGLYASGCGHPADQGLTFPGHFGKVLLTEPVPFGTSYRITPQEGRQAFLLTVPFEIPTPPPETTLS